MQEAERRFVTILFADLSGFTALTETRDPETVRELINACFDRFVPIIESHQGVIDQFVGDGIVALFGAPLAHEDDPAQACRAALEMLQAVEQVNAERAVNFGLHLGINSGTVLAGGIGSRGRQQYSVVGDAVNMASRLEDTAERGEIFVGAETYKLVREQFEFVSRGSMQFKGKSEAQAVWQLIRAHAQAPLRRRISTAAPLLGRRRELGILKRVARELMDEPPGLRVVSVLGEAGVGKTRLIQEWRDAALHGAARKPLHFLSVACTPDSTAHAYALIGELARALVGAGGKTDGGQPALAAVLGTDAPTREYDAPDNAALHAQYARALRDLVAERCQDDALVLVCEDLHWADAPSVHVLQRALGQLQDARVLLAFTSRLERDAPGWELVEALEELPGSGAVRLNLTPLGHDDTLALLSSMLPGRLPAEVQTIILAHAEGNPLFVEELARMLVDRGDLEQAAGTWRLNRAQVALEVPNTLQGVLMARVDQLPPEARHVLQVASVLGREFSLDVLNEVLRITG